MDEARHLHGREPGARIWIVADEQLAGRGRSGRLWRSPPGNLHMTLLAPTVLAPRDQPKLGFAAGVALAETAAALLPSAVAVRLKWPNDLLVDGAKASGILLEGLGGGSAVAMGLGVNIAAHPDDTPYRATHLSAFAPTLDRAGFFRLLAERLAAAIAGLESEGFAPLRRRWLARAAHLGRPISVRREERMVEGLFRDIDEDGRLLLDVDGSITRIDAGDVFPLDKGPPAAQERDLNEVRPATTSASIA
jgi:BirA family biotin operon repressor/biotin-[acetyl-CoA-carboxylase] ligase